ncbi:hypothetical protein JB92DRAFT_2828040 [Gautieria morchelliformis]|nr:hypothetical protein JB92DRAFT_2828040 [Gautieria morchelliformis]
MEKLSYAPNLMVRKTFNRVSLLKFPNILPFLESMPIHIPLSRLGPCPVEVLEVIVIAIVKTARGDLWVPYVLFLEHNRHNYQQLVSYAAVDKFARSVIKDRGSFHDGVKKKNGAWRFDSEVNAMAAWIFWFTDKGSFKYTSIHAPITSFHVPPSITPLLPPPTSALPLAALPFSRTTSLQDYFGFTLPFTHSLLVPTVFLNCAVRLEAAGAEMAMLLPQGYGSPTTMFADWGQGCGSEQYEHDWIRLLTCYIPWMPPMIRRRVFTPGMLKDAASSPLLHAYPRPMQFQLREYHAHDPSQLLGYNDSSQDFRSEGVFKAWLPQGVVMSETESFAATRGVLDEEFRRTGHYRDGVYDVVLTAQTGDRFSSVWGDKAYYGRVRDWDGLVLLFSVATPGEPSLIFSGYIHGNTNLVNRWRETATPVDFPGREGREGVWSMTKIKFPKPIAR